MTTKVMIGIPTAEYGRRADFYDYLNRMEKPNCFILTPHGSSPAQGRNLIIQNAIEQNCSHVLFLDDDMALPSDCLTKLLSHDKDCVSGLYFHRNYPHQPLIFERMDEKARAFATIFDKNMGDLIKIQAAGFGCVLIKTSVLKEMEQPWVRLGELIPDQWCDDIGFFHRLRSYTSDVWCDTTVRCGHISSIIFWPWRDPDGSWHTMYDTNNLMDGKGTVKVPQLSLTSEQTKILQSEGELSASALVDLPL